MNKMRTQESRTLSCFSTLVSSVERINSRKSPCLLLQHTTFYLCHACFQLHNTRRDLTAPRGASRDITARSCMEMLRTVIRQSLCNGSAAWVEVVALSRGDSLLSPDMEPSGTPQPSVPLTWALQPLGRAGLVPNASARDGWFIKCHPSRDTPQVPGWTENGAGMRRYTLCSIKN